MKPYYKNWKFYVISIALVLAAITVVGNLILSGFKQIAGLVFWIFLTSLFYYTCSLVIKGIPKNKNTLVNIAIVFAFISELIFVYAVFFA